MVWLVECVGTSLIEGVLQSLVVITREGLEAILILAAIIAYLEKAGQKNLERKVWVGAGLAVLASLATAFLFHAAFEANEGLQEVLEGLTLVVASLVLFYVSHWFLSKVEVSHWHAYIRGKVNRALEKGSGLALALTAFMAVYREGFETVLFYQALSVSVPPADLWTGLAAGLLVLAGLFWLVLQIEARLDLKTIFLVTSTLLIGLSIVFMGQGVHELQEAGWIGETEFKGLPKARDFGVFPTVETLFGQLAVGAAALFFLGPHQKNKSGLQ